MHDWRYTNKQTHDLNFATSSRQFFKTQLALPTICCSRPSLFRPPAVPKEIALASTQPFTKPPSDTTSRRRDYDQPNDIKASIAAMTSTRINYARRKRMLELAEEASSILSSETEELDHPVWSSKTMFLENNVRFASQDQL